MPDYNIKDIESLKQRISYLERAFILGVAAIILCLYFNVNYVVSVLIIAIIVIQIIKSRLKKQLKQKEYLAKIVEERTIELRVQRDQVVKESEDLSKALDALAEAQDELVRSERLATVGQLTKGLLDRILNPLNYINNFSDLSVELLADLKKNLTAEDAVLTKEIYADSIELIEMITNNLQKITEHGATTVRIVKAMEELLRDHKGNLTPADINNLCKVNLDLISRQFEKEIKEKNIKISFHGLALSLMIPVNIEQMSKVLLHIYQNGIYALLKKAEKENYEPELLIRLERQMDMINISILDNGIGIEEKIRGRVFEPFFTTKPTAEASGIGLYLSREIILNHRGTITITSEKNMYTEVLLSLPIHPHIEPQKNKPIHEGE